MFVSHDNQSHGGYGSARMSALGAVTARGIQVGWSKKTDDGGDTYEAYEITPNAHAYPTKWAVLTKLLPKSPTTFTAWVVRVKSALAPYPIYISLRGGDLAAPTQEETECAYGSEKRFRSVLAGRGYFVDGAFGARGFELTDIGFGTTALSPIKASYRIDQVDLAALQEDNFTYCQGFGAPEVTRVNNNPVDASYFGGRLHAFGNATTLPTATTRHRER